jgi:hypothetical protein
MISPPGPRISGNGKHVHRDDPIVSWIDGGFEHQPAPVFAIPDRRRYGDLMLARLSLDLADLVNPRPRHSPAVLRHWAADRLEALIMEKIMWKALRAD